MGISAVKKDSFSKNFGCMWCFDWTSQGGRNVCSVSRIDLEGGITINATTAVRQNLLWWVTHFLSFGNGIHLNIQNKHTNDLENPMKHSKNLFFVPFFSEMSSYTNEKKLRYEMEKYWNYCMKKQDTISWQEGIHVKYPTT